MTNQSFDQPKAAPLPICQIEYIRNTEIIFVFLDQCELFFLKKFIHTKKNALSCTTYLYHDVLRCLLFSATVLTLPCQLRFPVRCSNGSLIERLLYCFFFVFDFKERGGPSNSIYLMKLVFNAPPPKNTGKKQDLLLILVLLTIVLIICVRSPYCTLGSTPKFLSNGKGRDQNPESPIHLI